MRVLSSIVVMWFTVMCFPAAAHEIQPSIADVSVSRDEVTIVVNTRLEAMVAGIDQSVYLNTNDAPEAAEYDRLRALSPAELKAAVRADQARLVAGFLIDAGNGPVPVELLDGMSVPEVGDVEVARNSVITLRAVLPVGDTPVTIGWVNAYGPLVLRQVGAGDDAYTAYLEPGQISLPLPRSEFRTASGLASFVRYIELGFTHILPKGLDHILFVLGLFLFSLHLRPLLVQVTAFTLAHTVSLALATLKIVTVPPYIVEPLIALSIAWVAIENILWQKLTVWRTLVVFCFGLLHGMGFASVLGEIGLTPSRFFTSLIGFNIGVELGQLAIISAAYLLVAYWVGEKPWYRQVVVIPASLAIAAMGLWWAYERVFLA